MSQQPPSDQNQPQFNQYPLPPQRHTQYPQGYPQQQLPMMQPAPILPKKKRRKGLIIGGTVLVVVLALCSVISSTFSHNAAATTDTTSTKVGNTADTTSTDIPPLTPTPQSIHYPPTTETDLHGLAAKGVASAIHPFHSESVGLGACPQPKREVTVDLSVTGRQLAEDLLAYFYAEQLDSPCGSIVFVYHNQEEANDAYTAGRINFDATDSSGTENSDPNANNLKYTLTLDIGGLNANHEYIITY